MICWKETGNLERCLEVLEHHAAPFKMPLAPDQKSTEAGQHREKSNYDCVLNALRYVRKIRELAVRTQNADLSALLDEQFEFGK